MFIEKKNCIRIRKRENRVSDPVCTLGLVRLRHEPLTLIEDQLLLIAHIIGGGIKEIVGD